MPGIEHNHKRIPCRLVIFDKDGTLEVSQPKPHPEMVLSICHQLSIPPRETVFIGDTVNDMKMGKRAGLALTVGVVEGGVTPREELEKVADFVVDSIQELQFYYSERPK